MQNLVFSGEIQPTRLYLVLGTQSVVYNSVIYSTNETFRGIVGVKTFTYIGSGSQQVSEVSECQSGVIEFQESPIILPTIFNEHLKLKSFSIEFSLNDAEKIVKETTVIKGFCLEIIDYPLFSFEITESRL